MVPVDDVRNGLIYITAYLAIFMILIALRRPCAGQPGLLRRIAHILVVLGNLPAPFVLHSPWTVLILEIIFMIFLLVIRRFTILEDVFTANRKSHGDLYLPPTFLILFLMARNRVHIYAAALLVLAVSDPLATIVGRIYGKPSKSPFGGQKTISGFLAFFLSSYLIILCVLGSQSPPVWGRLLWQALLAAMIASSTEYCSPFGSDNATVPLAVLCSLSLLEYSFHIPVLRVLLPGVIGMAVMLVLSAGSRRSGNEIVDL